MKRGVSILLFLVVACSYLQAATVTGRVVDARTRQPLPGATVGLRNTNFFTTADREGNYLLSNIPPGQYELLISFVGYAPRTDRIRLTADQTLVRNLALTEQAGNIGEVSVKGLLNRETETASRRSEHNADNIINVVSSARIEGSPDINVANVLQRMSGITLQRSNGDGGSFAIIRGIEPRYNNTTINGVKVTSPDEKSRFVPLDIIPADLLQRIEISKALMPTMEGDAIGGTINLVMKDAPQAALLRASASLGYSALFFRQPYTTFNQSVIQPKGFTETRGADYRVQPADFSRENLNFVSKTPPPSGTAGLTWGNRFGSNRLGVLIGASYQNQFSGAISEFNAVTIDQFNTPSKSDVANRAYSTNQVNYGLNLHVDYQLTPRHKLNFFNTLLLSDLAQVRLSVDTSLIGNGRTHPGTGFINPVDRSLTNHQIVENAKLDGTLQLADNLLLNYAGVLSYAAKRAPDRAEITTDYKIDDQFHRTATFFDQISRIWQRNADRDYTGLLNLTYLPKRFGDALELRTGGLYRTKSRENRQDSYILKPTLDSATGQKQVFTSIESAQWSVYNPAGTYTYDVNNYQANEQVGAFYAQGRYRRAHWQVLTGVRVETTNQSFQINTVTTSQLNHATVAYTDILPSLHLTYRPSDRQNWRASYFRSISRPGYFELVPYQIRGQDSDEVGNPNLRHAVADNLDLRYELYPNANDQLLIGAFYKRIMNPIEYAFTSFSGGQLVYTPRNFGTATNIGLEVAFSKYVGNWGISGNYTYTHSRISSPKIFNDPLTQTASLVLQQRPLQGQTDHVGNLSLLYRQPASGWFVQVAYGYNGRTLRQVTSFLGTDYYQRPQHTLAGSVEKRAGEHLVVFAKLNNLLNTSTIIEVNTNHLIVQRDVNRASYLLGLRYTR